MVEGKGQGSPEETASELAEIEMQPKEQTKRARLPSLYEAPAGNINRLKYYEQNNPGTFCQISKVECNRI